MLPKSWQEFFAHQAEQRAEKNLVRKLRVLRHLAAGRVQVGSHELINFSSNDYLGLAGDLSARGGTVRLGDCLVAPGVRHLDTSQQA